jgi:hypothetical protein
MCAGRYLTADFGQMQVHRRRVDVWQHQRGTDAARGTNRAEDVGPIVTLIPRSAWTTYVRLPCWPTRASSCHHSSIGFPRACSGVAAATSSA